MYLCSSLLTAPLKPCIQYEYDKDAFIPGSPYFRTMLLFYYYIIHLLLIYIKLHIFLVLVLLLSIIF